MRFSAATPRCHAHKNTQIFTQSATQRDSNEMHCSHNLCSFIRSLGRTCATRVINWTIKLFYLFLFWCLDGVNAKNLCFLCRELSGVAAHYRWINSDIRLHNIIIMYFGFENLLAARWACDWAEDYEAYCVHFYTIQKLELTTKQRRQWIWSTENLFFENFISSPIYNLCRSTTHSINQIIWVK